MRIDIVSAALPPKLDGIGDYTARLTNELSQRCQIRILTTEGPHTPIPNARIESVFSAAIPRSVRNLANCVASDPPDCLLVQFNQFSYGRWGWNPYLPLTLQGIRRRFPAIRQIMMMHEDFVPIINWKFAIMTLWQRAQFRALGRNADTVLFSIDPWVHKYRNWFPGRQIAHLPVGSNIPCVPIEREEARARLGIEATTGVIGIFGTAHSTRLLGMARNLAETACRAGKNILILYIGPHGAAIRETFAGLPMITEGPLPAEEVSRRLAAIDVYMVPYQDGVSTRRTTMMAGLQHGLATVGTRGMLTDTMLEAQHTQALFLADNDDTQAFVDYGMRLLDDIELRTRMGQAARAWYTQEFDWPGIADRLLAIMQGDVR